MATYYCEHCGMKASSVSGLTSGKCPRHPSGDYKGFHKLYEGSEKSHYVCKYCGMKSSSISGLTTGKCPRHPEGNYKRHHSPAL